ncbi:MAG: hypothetical protein M3Z22_01295, partial [Verrucomicrobiota bacterium]|nr:hypothetical protein [Verrucomicrobiota bacterium]
IGDLNDLVAPPRDPNAKVYEMGPFGDGYRPAGEAMKPEKVAPFLQALADAREQTAPKLIDPYAEHEYRTASAAIRGLGAIPVFLVAPTVEQAPLLFREHPEPPPGAVLRFNDARRYPQFYDPAVRFDEGHLSRAGAEQFTKELAELFAAELSAGGIR